jgi:hypothetical protein
LDQGELQRAHVARRDRDLRRQLHQVRLQRTRARLAYVRQKARASPNNHCTCAKLFFFGTKKERRPVFFCLFGKRGRVRGPEWLTDTLEVHADIIPKQGTNKPA